MITSSASGELGETMVDDLKIQLHQAAMDKQVKAIVLYVDSPGGEVTASDMIYDAVCRARNRKPVVVYMGSLAASGGYYVSCGGSYLMADDTSLTGSIGVIIETLNYQSLMGKVGRGHGGVQERPVQGHAQRRPPDDARGKSICAEHGDADLWEICRHRRRASEKCRRTNCAPASPMAA